MSRVLVTIFASMVCFGVVAAPGATIGILSSTEGAEIRIDGQVVGTVPLFDPITVPEGRHRVILSRPGFLEYAEEVDLVEGAHADIVADLVAAGALLTLTADAPAGTKAPSLVATVDGQAVGVLPLEAALTPGKHHIEVFSGDTRVFQRDLFVMRGMQLAYRVKARPNGPDKATLASINVISTTEGARVRVEGIEVGTVPLVAPLEVPPGTYEVRVERRGYLPYSETVALEAGGAADVLAELIATSALLEVSGHFGARVEVDGVEVGIVPFEADLPPGQHRVSVQAEGAGRLMRTVSLAAGETLRIEYRPSLATEGSVGAAVVVARPWYKTWWFWTGTGAVVAGGVATAVILAAQGPDVPHADSTIRVP